MFDDNNINNNDQYRENKTLNHNEVLVMEVYEVESNDEVR